MMSKDKMRRANEIIDALNKNEETMEDLDRQQEVLVAEYRELVGRYPRYIHEERRYRRMEAN